MAKRLCSFCGGALSNADRSIEHVIPEWLLNLLEIRRDEKHRAYAQMPSGEILTQRSFGARQIKYGLVCTRCNTGWMSELERAVQRVFTQLFTMTALSLTAEECSHLAFWAYKTSALLSLTADESRRGLIRPGTLAQLYAERKLPNTADVGMLLAIPEPDLKARTVIHQPEFIDQKPVAASRHEFGELVKGSSGYVTILQFAHVVLRVADVTPRHRWKIVEERIAPQVRLCRAQTTIAIPWPPKALARRTAYDVAKDIKFSLRSVD